METLNVREYNDGKTAVVNDAILVTLPNQSCGTANLATSSTWWQVKDKKKGWQVVLFQSQR